MTRHVLSVILSLSVFGTTASAAFAQQGTSSRRPVEATTTNSLKMQLTEDIEIMRRLLDATVKELYATVSARPGLSISLSGKIMTSTITSDWPVPFRHTTDVPGNTKRISNLQLREPIGTYLNGHGIVYLLELPPLSEPPKTAKTETKKTMADCPFMSLSKWDRTRKNLSGELKKVNCSECHAVTNLQSADDYFKSNYSSSSKSTLSLDFGVLEKPSVSVLTRDALTERLIDLLAENGHHIRNLPSPQFLTLSVTFRHQSPVPQMGAEMGSMMSEMRRYSLTSAPASVPGSAPGRISSTGNPIGLPGPPRIPQRVSGKSSSGKTSSRVPPQNSKIVQKRNMSGVGGLGRGFGFSRAGGFGSASGGGLFGSASAKLGNEELAGDLHMRQENFKKAVEEYEKALKESFSSTEKFYYSPMTMKDMRPENSRLLRKLAVALLRGGENTKAKAVLDKLAAIESTIRSSPPKPPETPSVSLPARLVISVTKANLDAVASGKMSREEFRKQISIDYFDPASVKPKQDDTQQSKP